MSAVADTKTREFAQSLLSFYLPDGVLKLDPKDHENVRRLSIDNLAQEFDLRYITPEDFIAGHSTVAIDQVIADYRRLGELWYSIMSWVEVAISLHEDLRMRKTLTTIMASWSIYAPATQLALNLGRCIRSTPLDDDVMFKRLRQMELDFRKQFASAAKVAKLEIEMKQRLLERERSIQKPTQAAVKKPVLRSF